MKTKYRILNTDGKWEIISSKTPIRNVNEASKIVGYKIEKVAIGTLIDQLKFWK